MNTQDSLIRMLKQLVEDMQVIQQPGSGYYSCVAPVTRYNKLLGVARELVGSDNSHFYGNITVNQGPLSIDTRKSLGTNTVNVTAYTWNGSSGVNLGKALYDYCLGMEDVVGASPKGQIWNDLTIKYESKTLARNQGGGMSAGTTAVGVSGEDEYPQIMLGNDKFSLCSGYTVVKGRDLSYLDIEKLNQVCVLGSATAEYLFSFADPIGKTVFS